MSAPSTTSPVVADSGSGVSVVDIQTIASPVIVAQVDTPGNAVAVASGDLIAVADGLAGLAVIDISDPPAAEIVHQVALGGAAQAVVAGGGVAYVGLTSGELAVVDLESGALIGQLSFSQAVEDLALAGDRLYVLTAGELHAIFIEDLSVVGSAASPGSSSRRHRLFVGGGVAYTAHSRGYNTFDISSPGAPALIAAGNTTQFGWKQIVPNGSGLGVAVVGATLGAGNVSLYDVSDASLTNEFITTFNIPGNAAAVAIHNGLAYVADGARGLQVVNYLAYDAFGLSPTLSLSTNFVPGLAEEGQVMRVTASVSDDVQVRNVEFFVDGVKVATDGNFAFEHRFVTALIAEQPSFTLRVRATDTGGNATSTAETVITLTTDATPPRASRVSPENGSFVRADLATAISATFSEPIDPATLNDATFRLFSAGPDGIAGNADDVPVAGGIISFRDDISTAFLTFGTPLPPDSYSAELSVAITDLVGNSLASDVTWTFGVVTPVSWDGGGDGTSWHDPLNWDPDALPGPTSIVVIDIVGDITVTHSQGATSIYSLESEEALVLSGGSLSVVAESVLNSTFTLSGGTLKGTGNVVLNGLSTWTGGDMSGTGKITIPATAQLNISGGSIKDLRGRTIDNLGTTTWTGTGDIRSGNGAVFNNLADAVFDVRNDEPFRGDLGGAASVFNNVGTFRKSVTTGVTSINLFFNNTGTVDVDSGTLSFTTGGTSTGNFDVSTTSTILQFPSSTFRLNIGTTITGVGTTLINGGTLIIGGTATSTNAVTALNLDLVSGTLRGSGDLTMSANGQLDWTGGNISGTGKVTIPETAELNISGTANKDLRNRTIDNLGTMTWTGTGNIRSGNGAVFNNLAGGVFDVQNDEFFSDNLGGAAPRFNNAGTFKKTVGTGTTNISLVFNNTGVVDVDSGLLSYNSGGTSTGSFDVATGATLRFPSSTFTLNIGTTITGVGTTRIDGGTVTIGATATSTNAVTALNLDVVSGTLNGSGDLTMAAGGQLDWTGGTMNGGGKITIPETAELNISGTANKDLRNRTIDNLGTTTWTGTGNIRSGDGGVFNNLAGGVFDVQNDESFHANLGGAVPRFNNAGTFQKSAGLGTTTISVSFINTGTVLNTSGGILTFTNCTGCPP